VIDASGNAGEVLAAMNGELVVAAGRGALRLLTVQRPGARRMPVADFLRGAAVRRGHRFDAVLTD
jgi:methionyl-tRNA formyltransferase